MYIIVMTDKIQQELLFNLAHSQLFSMWSNIRSSMLWAHEEIIRLQAKIVELEKQNANS